MSKPTQFTDCICLYCGGKIKNSNIKNDNKNFFAWSRGCCKTYLTTIALLQKSTCSKECFRKMVLKYQNSIFNDVLTNNSDDSNHEIESK